MSLQLAVPDENENVLENGAKQANDKTHQAVPQSPDCSLNITLTETSVLSDYDEEAATFAASTRLASSPPVSPSPPSCSPNIVTSPIPFKAQLYRTIRNCVWAFPLLIVFLVPIVCLIPYTMAVQYGQLNPVFPYVSDAGGLVPQAALFSQLLDVIAILIFIASYIRYKMVKYYIQFKMVNSAKVSQRMFARMHQLNFAGALTAYTSAFGVVILANFRVTELAAGHFFGAFFAFFAMYIYMCIMSYITYQLSRCDIESRPYSMSVISTTAGASLFFCLVFSAVSIFQAGFWRFFENSFRLQWTKKEDGYTAHVIGTAFEWVSIQTVGPFFLCIFSRMKQFKDWNKVTF